MITNCKNILVLAPHTDDGATKRVRLPALSGKRKPVWKIISVKMFGSTVIISWQSGNRKIWTK